MTLNPVAAQTLAPHLSLIAAPVARFNDDDLYLYRADSRELVEQVGSGSPRRRAIVQGREALPAGVTFANGMAAKRLGLWTPSDAAALLGMLDVVRESYLSGKPPAHAHYMAANKLLSKIEMSSAQAAA